MNVEEHISDEKKKEGREYKINRRRGAKKKLEPNDQLIFEIEEFAKSTVRSKVEHVFGVVKRMFRINLLMLLLILTLSDLYVIMIAYSLYCDDDMICKTVC